MTPLGMKIKNIIKKNRKDDTGIQTQQDLAEKIKCSNSHLSAVITGEAKPSLALLTRIAAELNISLSDLLKED